MGDSVHITYLYDPLCGWCYGASDILLQLADLPGLDIRLAPTGLFSGDGARRMDAQLAAFAWSNDQRIAKLTGQRFSEDYRKRILGNHKACLDSTLATLALTAVALAKPSEEVRALRLIQEARYVAGRDVTDLDVLSDILGRAGMAAESARLSASDDHLLTSNRQRVESARSTRQEFRVDGVPALIVDDGQGRRQVPANELFSNAGLVNDLMKSGARQAEPQTRAR